ncbi:MAG: hypothetical protein AAF446_01815 [Pseudomonadota bacterium]
MQLIESNRCISGEQVNGMPRMRNFSAEEFAVRVTLNSAEAGGPRSIGPFAAEQPRSSEFTLAQARVD